MGPHTPYGRVSGVNRTFGREGGNLPVTLLKPKLRVTAGQPYAYDYVICNLGTLGVPNYIT